MSVTILPTNTTHRILSISTPKRVMKGWGYEEVIYNGKEYCGKILHYKTDAKSSGHIHREKHESWYIASGVFDLIYIDGETGKEWHKPLSKGMTVIIPPCCYHEVKCIAEGDIFESSTPHKDEDTYRFKPGDSQNKV